MARHLVSSRCGTDGHSRLRKSEPSLIADQEEPAFKGGVFTLQGRGCRGRDPRSLAMHAS